ncbi:putative hydrolase of the HAD superfamily [Nocardia tenerifensis]|uniref:Putative hydrolase of the HAD superfamily n=1 Tax=Nocardia tenerifensis TaxID=228006 RepID=A0A318KEE9_9NOCA|nr:putative hydrolase of the HAD superfamily [Nocardia tenerifensis]
MLGRADDSPRVLIVDYGGVLTNPIAETIGHFANHLEIEPAELLAALAAAGSAGETIMAPLERAEISEAEFLDRMSRSLTGVAGRAIDLRDFRTVWFSGRFANHMMLDRLAELRGEGRTLALLTNNVREWEPYWRAQVPADTLFDVVVNSADEGVRKPDEAIYHIAIDRLGVAPRHCLFVDDDLTNCQSARAVGMRVHHFVDTPGAVTAIDEWFGRTTTGALPVVAGNPGAGESS